MLFYFPFPPNPPDIIFLNLPESTNRVNLFNVHTIICLLPAFMNSSSFFAAAPESTVSAASLTPSAGVSVFPAMS